ncbi:hypothetical protein GCM10010987_49930 [Bradyrhizobium guangdongense]|uniref:Transposase n=1 Tax=Bradyrhizobium guangdongense TaxID=1325090 RepID=A0A410V8V5_9BRAD|nr:hypothetical protein X265_22425 [Bradyrhizobium guangdongense]QOZ61183.1 hypothetical protein XH86_22450 [Bradyrhizobium guangdongense]GGI28544.1 hypothetical protein GCM10010987_49930 [Bradyrhizobium guangdongense]
MGARDFSQWLPISRCEDRFGSAERRAGVMRVIKGIIGAIGTVKSRWRRFAARAAVTKTCSEIGPSEEEFTFYFKQFSWRSLEAVECLY